MPVLSLSKRPAKRSVRGHGRSYGQNGSCKCGAAC
jgi:hypothetical protein